MTDEIFGILSFYRIEKIAIGLKVHYIIPWRSTHCKPEYIPEHAIHALHCPIVTFQESLVDYSYTPPICDEFVQVSKWLSFGRHGPLTALFLGLGGC